MASQEDEDAFIAALEKLADHLNRQKQKGLNSDKQEFEPVCFQFTRRFREAADSQGEAANDGLMLPR